MKQILNLGCGKGQNIGHIIERWHITNVDIEQKFVDIAKFKFPQCDYICSPAEKLEFENEYFDEIYAFDVLEHVTDLDLVMQKLYNLLKKDGLLYIEVPYDKSEYSLINVNPKYFDQIGHQRVFSFKDITKTFNDYWFYVKKNRKTEMNRSYIFAIIIHILNTNYGSNVYDKRER
jgi:SAM-dependent methyltransferase